MRTLSSSVKAFCSLLLAVHIILLSGCAPAAKVTMSRAFNPAPEQNIVFVLPFANSLVPETAQKWPVLYKLGWATKPNHRPAWGPIHMFTCAFNVG